MDIHAETPAFWRLIKHSELSKESGSSCLQRLRLAESRYESGALAALGVKADEVIFVRNKYKRSYK